MEEKKIIGQECEFYNEGHCLCYSDESHYPHCLEYPNCYYKQLQLKDKMIEKVKEILNSHCYFVTEDGAFMLKQDILQALAELSNNEL